MERVIYAVLLARVQKLVILYKSVQFSQRVFRHKRTRRHGNFVGTIFLLSISSQTLQQYQNHPHNQDPGSTSSEAYRFIHNVIILGRFRFNGIILGSF